MEPAN
jgi:hypothetical protein